jgi:hypothetical protein
MIRPVHTFLLALCASVALIAVFAPVALAQDTDGPAAIVLQPIIEYAIAAVGAVLSALLAWGLKEAAGLLGIKKNAQVLKDLEPLINNAVSYAERKALNWSEQQRGLSRIEIENEKIAAATNQVIQQAPKYLKKAGITPAMLQSMIEGLMDTPERDREQASELKKQK